MLEEKGINKNNWKSNRLPRNGKKSKIGLRTTGSWMIEEKINKRKRKIHNCIKRIYRCRVTIWQNRRVISICLIVFMIEENIVKFGSATNATDLPTPTAYK